MIRHKDLKDGAVGVSGDGDGGGLDAGLVVNTIPKAGSILSVRLGDGEDEVRGLAVKGSDGGVRRIRH
ncbi:hypothetical protein MUK42_12877 [Musa troglodytarum]|uniref:Uncharacterized protein n=1 Tax=Musa troglodytarum TaxID=320322 RepID=A0A9E7GR57_9LILI|nr:hypothetical protein MUK42_12877 [Musa troglodytarum]